MKSAPPAGTSATSRITIDRGRTVDFLGEQLRIYATPELVRQIVRRLDRNEYKRRQSPLVLRTSPKAFGSGRRLPIVHRYEAG